MTIRRVAIIGLGLIGGSIGLAVRENLPDLTTTGWDADSDVRAQAAARGLVDTVGETPADAVRDADLVILCVPVGAMAAAAQAIAAHIAPGTIVSDVGSSKRSVCEALGAALPEAIVIPAHPVAGTENSGPDAGFATLFRQRWCIVTPTKDTPQTAVDALADFWVGLGATVEVMDARHHDLVLAVTSHIPHLIAYTIVGTASDLE
ncbi:MAG TPA: prephenate/arogenate dehydrogenase family protein, partial [Erythrobacter sp.]|nr:prephenate/arogenate dehydrogenase family protein [Erythrobacter sp.]